MIDEVLTADPQFPDHLHRHIVQNWLIKHRRPPLTEQDRRRAVAEYLVRGAKDRTGLTRVLAGDALAAWLGEPDERVQGWGPVPRLAGLLHQFNPDLRKRYDLGAERDYKEFACYVALTLFTKLQWPEAIVGDTLRRVLWETAPGVKFAARVGMTRGMQFVRRNGEGLGGLDLAKPEDASRLLLTLFAEIDEGKLPSYVLSPDQYADLAGAPGARKSGLRLTGLLRHLVIERGRVNERELENPQFAAQVQAKFPMLLANLRLPAPLREAHAKWLRPAIEVAAPAPDAEMVTVFGPLGHGSGLGAASRACVAALRSARVPCEVLNLKTAWGRNNENAGAPGVTRARGDINILHFNPDVIIENIARFGLEQFEGRYNIGHFYWETSKATLAHRLGASLVDEIWVSTEYCGEIFRQVTDKPVIVARVPVAEMGDLSWASLEYFGLRKRAFTFLYTFDGASRLTRKNPLAAVRAFQRAFPSGEDVQLVLKLQNTDWLTAADEKLFAELRRVARADRRLVLVNESFSSREVHGLIASADCYVALHRSEGFGYGMAEAMKLGVPVIATGYSGNADFTTELTAYPVRHRLVPVSAADFVYDEPGQEWAEPDVEHAAERMLEVVAGRGRNAKVERAKELIERVYGEAAVGAVYRERIETVRARRADGREAAPAAA